MATDSLAAGVAGSLGIARVGIPRNLRRPECHGSARRRAGHGQQEHSLRTAAGSGCLPGLDCHQHPGSAPPEAETPCQDQEGDAEVTGSVPEDATVQDLARIIGWSMAELGRRLGSPNQFSLYQRMRSATGLGQEAHEWLREVALVAAQFPHPPGWEPRRPGRPRRHSKTLATESKSPSDSG